MSNYILIPGNTAPVITYTASPEVTKSTTPGSKKFAFFWSGVLPALTTGSQLMASSGAYTSSNMHARYNSAGGIQLRLRTDTTNAHQLDLAEDGVLAPGTPVWFYGEADFDAGTFKGVLNGVLIDTINISGEDYHGGPYGHGIGLHGFSTVGDDQKIYEFAGWYNRIPDIAEILEYEADDDLAQLTDPPDAWMNFTGTPGAHATPIDSLVGEYTWSQTQGPTSGGTEPVFGAEGDTAPVMPADASVSIDEGTADPIGTYAAVSGTGPITYSLSGADAALFTVNSTTAQLSPASGIAYGGSNTYVVNVVGTNAQGSDSTQVTVTVLEVVETPEGANGFFLVPGVAPSADPVIAAHVYSPLPTVDKSATAGERKVAILIAAKLPVPPSGVQRMLSSSPVAFRDMRIEVNTASTATVRMRTSTENAHSVALGNFTAGEIAYIYAEADFDDEQFTAALNGVEGTPASLAGQTWDLVSNPHGVSLHGLTSAGADTQYYAVAAWYNKKPVKSEALAFALGDDLSEMTVPPDAQINFVGTTGSYAESLSALIGSFSWEHNSGAGAPTAGSDAPVFGADGAPEAPTMPADSAISINEGTTNAGTHLAISGTGPIVYSLTGTDAALFTINANTAVLSFSQAPVFADPQDSDANNVYVVNVVATNAQGSDSKQVTITVLEVAVSTPPAISSVTGARAGSFTIAGSGFTGTSAVTINGVAATSFSAVSDTSITGVWPQDINAAFNTSVNVVVTNPDGSDTEGVTWRGPLGHSQVTLTSLSTSGDIYLANQAGIFTPAVVAGDVASYRPTMVGTDGEGTFSFAISAAGAFVLESGAPEGTYQIEFGVQDASDDYAWSGTVSQFVEIVIDGASNPSNPVFVPDGPLQYFDAQGALQTIANQVGVRVAVYSAGGIYSGVRVYSGTFNIPANGALPTIDSDLLGEVGDTIEVFYQTADGRRSIPIQAVVTDGNV